MSTVLVLTSCEGKEPKDIMVENEAALTQTSFADETSGKSGVTFVTSGAWTSTITEGPTKSTKTETTSWVSISPGRGDAAGTYTIIISLEPNTTGEDRKATITISCNGMDITIAVTQKGVSVNDKQTSGITYPETGKYGPNILSDKVVMVKKTEWGRYEYSVRVVVPEGSSLKIVIKSVSTPSGYAYSQITENWSVSSWNNNLNGNTWSVYESGKPADGMVIFDGDCIVEYYENGATTPTKVKNLYIGGDAEDDEAHERDMLIVFYKSTNGDEWIRKDNWCSNEPISKWYGVETYYHQESKKNRVSSIALPNNNLTGAAYLADLKGLYNLNILSGNKIESLTIDNCGSESPNRQPVFYHDNKYSLCNLEALNISNSNSSIYMNGNFSAKSVTISNCNLSAQEYMCFNLPSTTIGTLTVSDCTMSYFYADNSIIGNIIIDNCTFLDRAYIYVGNKTQVNNCRGLRSIFSSRKCSDLIVTNTICNDIQCKNDKE